MIPRFSFEVFPPKTEGGLATLGATTSALSGIDPTFISVTYGAGGNSQDRSFAAIETVHANADGTDIAGHLTCVGQSKADVEQVIDHYTALNVNRIVALRGDPPAGVDAAYSPHPEGFTATADLVSAIKSRTDCWVAVSAYPEVHPQSINLAQDLDVLAAKVAAGADAAMTQMFFDNRYYFDYVAAVRDRGIDVEIIPGIFPIHSFDAVSTFAQRCGASMPLTIADRFAQLEHRSDPEAAKFDTAVSVATDQILELAACGVTSFHLYTLNRPELALAVCASVNAQL